MEGRLDDDQLQAIYTWVDQVPLSRPKRNIARDFSDGVLFAEIVHHYHPRLVDLHNYSAANGLKQKTYNWETLQKKTLRRLKLVVTPDEIQAVAAGQQHQIERLLLRLKTRLATYQPPSRGDGGGSRPGSGRAGSLGSSASSLSLAQHGAGGGPGGGLGGSSSSFSSGLGGLYDGGGGGAAGGPARDARDEDAGGARWAGGPLRGGLAGDAGDAQTMVELRDTISILELKVSKLEQLLQLKDRKIDSLQEQLRAALLAAPR